MGAFAAILIFGGLGGLIWFFVWLEVSSRKQSSEERERNANEYESWISDNEIIADIVLRLETIDYSPTIIIDNQSKRVGIYIPRKLATPPEKTIIPFSQIIGYEITQNNQRLNSVGRGITGAILGGEAGAIIAAATDKEEVRRFSLIVYTTDINNPSIEIVLGVYVDNKGKAMTIVYQVNSFLSRVGGYLKAIIYSNEEENKQNLRLDVSKQLGNPEISLVGEHGTGTCADRLLELKGLWDAGLITEEEYHSKKTEILSNL